MLQNPLLYAGLLGVTSAHSIFSWLIDGATTYPESYAIRDPSYDGPIQDVTTQYIACNGGPNPTTPSSDVITVNAGDTVEAVWRHTLTSTIENDATYVIDPSHKGPTLAYLKKVTDAVTDVGYGDGWFKIQEDGLNVATQDWAITDLIANGGNQAINIPTCIEPGQYLLRAELIALHAASSPEGAQFYMECAQLNITGSGSATPPTVAFPGAYSATDPGILINIYQTLSTYVIPGPTLFTCGGGSQPTTSVAAPTTLITTTTRPTTTTTSTTVTTRPTTTTSKTTTTTTTTTTTSKTTTTSAAATGGTGSPLYGQCGGNGWTGPTTCASGTCTYSNPYYSQCLPA